MIVCTYTQNIVGRCLVWVHALTLLTRQRSTTGMYVGMSVIDAFRYASGRGSRVWGLPCDPATPH